MQVFEAELPMVRKGLFPKQPVRQVRLQSADIDEDVLGDLGSK
jgi:hypothetical protein